MPRATPGPDLSFPITHTHLSHFLRISGMKLSELTDRGIIRRGTDQAGRPLVGQYRFDTALGDYLGYLAKVARSSGELIETERARLIAVKRETAELRLGMLQGDLISQTEAAEVLRSTLLRTRSKFSSLLGRLVRAVYHASSLEEGHRRAQDFFEEALAELGRFQAKDLNPNLTVVDHEDEPDYQPTD